MAEVNKIDSNATGLSYAKEETYGALPTSPLPVWYPLEPNSYDDFGGEVTTVARNPINPSRQRKKGVVTDLDASGGWETDLTQENMQDLLQGFFFAALRTKDELTIAVLGGSPVEYQPASGGDGYVAGDLLFAKGFSIAGNNGLKTVTSSDATSVIVSETLTADTGEAGTVSRVGFRFGSGEVEIDASGNQPILNRASGAKDFTDFGIIPGEWIWVGGDATADQFAMAANNCLARVRSVTATQITFDKTDNTMVTDGGSGKTIVIYFGRVVKNESSPSLIFRQSYQFERTLGAPDDASPSAIQSEYLVGAIASELNVQVNTADKLMASLSYVGKDVEQRTAVDGVKAGTRVVITEADAFNTSSDIQRIKLSAVDDTDSNVDPLFAFVQEMSFSINNNLTPNKAVGVLGSFDVTSGTFEVNADLTAYFNDVAAVTAVRNNTSITLDLFAARENAGFVIDLPLTTLGDGRPNVEQDEPITLPLSNQAATGALIDSNLDHTALMVFFDYLPDLATA